MVKHYLAGPKAYEQHPFIPSQRKPNLNVLAVANIKQHCPTLPANVKNRTSLLRDAMRYAQPPSYPEQHPAIHHNAQKYRARNGDDNRCAPNLGKNKIRNNTQQYLP